jgi:putative transposase
MQKIDYFHTAEPAWGVNKIRKLLQNEGISASKELVSELMREMGLHTIYPHFNTSKADKNARKRPYLLRNMEIFLPNQVWAADITYIKMGKSHMFLTAIIDWFSRLITGWWLSDTIETAPVIAAFESAFSRFGIPAIVNTDQGSQFTSDSFSEFLRTVKIRQSMDGKARWADNVIIKRWFRSLKVERIYI